MGARSPHDTGPKPEAIAQGANSNAAWTGPKRLADIKVTDHQHGRTAPARGTAVYAGAGNYRVLSDDRIPTNE